VVYVVMHRVMNRSDEVVTCLVRAGFTQSTNVSTVIDPRLLSAALNYYYYMFLVTRHYVDV